jgi:hypothetical protein
MLCSRRFSMATAPVAIFAFLFASAARCQENANAAPAKLKVRVVVCRVALHQQRIENGNSENQQQLGRARGHGFSSDEKV